MQLFAILSMTRLSTSPRVPLRMTASMVSLSHYGASSFRRKGSRLTVTTGNRIAALITLLKLRPDIVKRYLMQI